MKRKGFDIKWGEDFGSDEEKALCQEFTQPFFIVGFPENVVAFYYKLYDDNPRMAHRIDFFWYGEYGVELASGGLREHRVDVLINRLKAKNLNIESFKWYIDMFKYGFPPHGGFGLGIERLLMSLLKLERIHETILYPRTPDILVP